MSSDSPKAASGSEQSRAASGNALPAGAASGSEAAEVKPSASPETSTPDYYGQLLRLKAEFENYRKRVDREKPELYRMGKAEVLLRLLPIYDLLQQAHAEVQRTHMDTPLAQGMEGIFKEFEKIFTEEGVSPMSPVGRPYDPLQHEVMGKVETPGFEEGVVVEVLQNGYLLQDKVLRPAKVRVAGKI